MRRAIFTITIIALGSTLAAQQDAWAWGEARIKSGRATVSQGRSEVGKARTQRGKIIPGLRKGVGNWAMVPGAGLAGRKTAAMKNSAKAGMKAFGTNTRGAVGNSVKGRWHLLKGRAQLAVGHTQKAISNVGNWLWNSKVVSAARLGASAGGIIASKTAGVVSGARTFSMTKWVTKNGGSVPKRYIQPRNKPAAPAAPVGANQLMDLGSQLK